jgi:hypothetical protein
MSRKLPRSENGRCILTAANGRKEKHNPCQIVVNGGTRAEKECLNLYALRAYPLDDLTLARSHSKRHSRQKLRPNEKVLQPAAIRNTRLMFNSPIVGGHALRLGPRGGPAVWRSISMPYSSNSPRR